ncbi:MAG: hypothetical protein M1321_01795 [Candidatus Marsarchaeota archaeon]|nr:hypothetical protein [Candidatus Marsarchaeota archaeon]
MRIREVFARRRNAPAELMELQRQVPVHAGLRETPSHTVLFACMRGGQKTSIVQFGVTEANIEQAQDEIVSHSLLSFLNSYRQGSPGDSTPTL